MRLTLDQLSAFVKTVDKGGFRQAGLSLEKHGSTVGQLVAGLEIDFNIELFERSGRAVSLTSQGKDLYQYAVAVLREAELFEQKADSLNLGQPSRLTVAIDTALRSDDLSKIYARLLSEFPAIELKLLNGDPMQIRDWVLKGQADLGFSMSTVRTSPELSFARCYTFEVVQISSNDWEIPEGKLNLQQLRGRRQIAFSFLKQMGLEDAHTLSHKVLYCNNLHEIILQVSSGLGWAHVPRFSIKSLIAQCKLQQFHIGDEKKDFWHTEALWRSSDPINPVMQLFIDSLQELDDR